MDVNDLVLESKETSEKSKASESGQGYWTIESTEKDKVKIVRIKY